MAAKTVVTHCCFGPFQVTFLARWDPVLLPASRKWILWPKHCRKALCGKAIAGKIWCNWFYRPIRSDL